MPDLAHSLTYFCSTINIFNGKHLAQSVQKNFGKSWHQLGGCDQDVLTVFSERRKTLVTAHLQAVVPGLLQTVCSASPGAMCFAVLLSGGILGQGFAISTYLLLAEFPVRKTIW